MLVHYLVNVCISWVTVCWIREYINSRRSAPDRSAFRSSREFGFPISSKSVRYAFGFDWAVEPVPGSLARRRSSFVLRRRSRARTPAVRPGAGDGVPNRTGVGADADGVCHLQ